RTDHNLASGAVLVEYGVTRALFMSDAECQLWEYCLATDPPAELRMPVHFLKVSHHGSNNGYCRSLYSVVADPAMTVSVVTPFNHGNVHLPTAVGVQAVRPHVLYMYCTNRAAAEASTQLRWDPQSPPAIPRLPSRWTAMIRRVPALGRLLVPEARVPASAGRAPALPLEWVADAQRAPALWQLIRPAHRQPTATPNSTESHT